MKIGICDDDQMICSQVAEVIRNYLNKWDEITEIDIYDTGESLWEAMMSGLYFDIIFLDIELQTISGVEIGKNIREKLKNESTQIVYISSKQSYAMELFAVRPLNFLVKPLQEEYICQVLGKAIELLRKRKSMFSFMKAKEYYQIPIGEIQYIISQGKKLRVSTASKQYEYYGKLKDVEKQLKGHNFLQIHKSYFVNFDYVAECQYDSVTLINKENFSISQPYRKVVRETLILRKGAEE